MKISETEIELVQPGITNFIFHYSNQGLFYKIAHIICAISLIFQKHAFLFLYIE